MKTPNNAIVICTERSFEWKSRLLVRSIRAFGGGLSSARIVSYSPCADSRPSSGCFDEFHSLGVEIVTTPLNIDWPEYRLANKVVACAHAERNLQLDRIAFLDSDQIVVSAFPALFEDPRPFAARPVDVKNIGALNSSDAETLYWDGLYRMCGVQSVRTVRTTICRSRIREYFDSGMFSVNARAGILTAWKRNFVKVWRMGLRPTSGDYFVEQSCLAATVSAVAREISILPHGYNLPLDSLHRERELIPAAMHASPVSLHYHRLLDVYTLDDMLRCIAVFLSPEQRSWIRSNVKELCPSSHRANRERILPVRIPVDCFTHRRMRFWG